MLFLCVGVDWVDWLRIDMEVVVVGWLGVVLLWVDFCNCVLVVNGWVLFGVVIELVDKLLLEVVFLGCVEGGCYVWVVWVVL